MRLTDIFKTLFNSSGDEIFLGGTRLDGLIVDREGEELTISTIDSAIDDSNLRISRGTRLFLINSDIELKVASSIVFDSYSWSIDGDAIFVDGITTGPVVNINSSVEGANTVTLTGVIDSEERIVYDVIFLSKGSFMGAEIVGPSTIDYSDPVRYILDTTESPDTVVWSVIGDGVISDGTSQDEVFVTAGETWEDLILVAELQKADYITENIYFSISVNKCENIT